MRRVSSWTFDFVGPFGQEGRVCEVKTDVVVGGGGGGGKGGKGG